jgi:hypothetical protein
VASEILILKSGSNAMKFARRALTSIGSPEVVAFRKASSVCAGLFVAALSMSGGILFIGLDGVIRFSGDRKRDAAVVFGICPKENREMGFWTWLFGRPEIPVIENEPLPPLNLPTFNPVALRRPVAQPYAPTKALTSEPDEYWIDYPDQAGQLRRRRVVFLCAAPSLNLTAIDLIKRRIRTFRADRIGHITRADSPMAISYESLPPSGAFSIQDLRGTYDAHSMAVFLRKGLIAQLSIMKMLAETDGALTASDIGIMLEYARREARFAVNEGWVPTGEKKMAWPILGRMIPGMTPRMGHLDCYVGTINENWQNPHRFAVFNEFLQKLGQAQGQPSPAFHRMAAEIERMAGG